MKILLIQPPVQDFYRTSIRTQPIGLAYLAASLKGKGHEVEILDCRTEGKRSIPLPSELSYLKDYYPFNDRGPFKLYTGYYHFGMGWDEIRKKIEDSKADIFGISSSFTPYHGEALEIARIIKEWNSRKLVVMGGAHVSCDPESVLKSPFVDYAVMGEGEIRFSLLLEQIEKEALKGMREIDGIGYRVGERIQINPIQTFLRDLDVLPHPARELLDLDRYRIKKKRLTMIVTSRGCPHGCVYCSTHLVMGDSFRIRSPEGITQEMMECRDRYGIQIFDIEDDNFTFDQRRAKRLMNLIIEKFGVGGIELSAMNGVSFSSLDKELLRLMRKAGFSTINLSYVSTDPHTQEEMRRPKGITDFDKIVEEANRVGLRVIAYGIFGMPGQTIEEMVDTLVYLTGTRVLIGPSVYYPTPGTPLFERCKREDVLPCDPSQWRSSALPIETKDFNRLDIGTLFRLARMINFIKGKIEEGVLNERVTWKELFQILINKKKIEVEVKAEEEFYAPCSRGDAITWADLLLLFFQERSFFSLRKDFRGILSLTKEMSSKKVIDYFFEKAMGRQVLGNTPDG